MKIIREINALTVSNNKNASSVTTISACASVCVGCADAKGS